MAESLFFVLAQSNNDAAAAGAGFAGLLCSCIFFLIWLGIAVLVIAGLWKTFTKAGQPGWAAIIPIYNLYIYCKIVGRPEWWIILWLIPLVQLIAAVVMGIDLAKAFGKSEGFGVGIGLLPFIFIPMLGFSDAQYQGPSAA